MLDSRDPLAKGFVLCLVNGNIRTQDPSVPTAEALAVRAGRIATVGNTAAIAAQATADTRRIDLGGKLVRPEDIERLAHLDIAVSMQPHSAIMDIRMIEDGVGQ